MMKWLRDHTKQIMVVVVLLAMFSFVGAQGLQAILAPNPANETAMSCFGRDVKAGELSEADFYTNVLTRVFSSWKPQGASQDFNLRHWFMLAEEADRAGVEVSEARIEAYIRSVDSALAPAGGIDSLRQNQNIGLPQIRQALRRNFAIAENASRVGEAALPSEPQVRQYIRDTNEKISVKLAVFDATNFVDETAEISEDELQAQFDAHRDVMPADSEDGFGYRYPRRVSLQYVVVDPSAIRGQMNVSMDEIKDYWKSHKEKFMKTVQAPEPVDPTATQPAEPKMISKQEPKLFSEAKLEVESLLKREKAMRIARQAMNKIVDAMAKPWAESKRDSGTGYLDIPNDDVRDSAFMRRVVDEVQADFGIQLNYAELPLATESEIAGTPDLRSAQLQGANDAAAPIDISELAFRVPAFYKANGAETGDIHLQYFQTPPAPLRVENPFAAMMGARGRIFGDEKLVLFRVLEARDAESPASLDEVRDLVIRDVRERRAYEAMDVVSREFGVAAQQLGAETALSLFDELRERRNIKTISLPPPFARKQRRVPNSIEELESDDFSVTAPARVAGVGESEAFIDACFEMASEGWRPPLIQGPLSSQKLAKARSMPPATPAPKVQIVNLPKELKRVVVEFVKLDPVDRNEYETTLRFQGYREIASTRPTLRLWYDTKDIEERCQYVDKRPIAEDPKSGMTPDAPEGDDGAA
ncbi:MAG TPA: hypothetical protein P5081_06320 [Phycisphaerae bacterium]|nr:hypothetical protein [Phycisphaerae bacterium]HRW52484.1 hypothetical protein [Phycisphaerae bacterium]